MGSLSKHFPSTMGWLSVCLVGVLLTGARAMPVEEEELDMIEQEDMTELFTRLFVSAREGRDLEMEINNEIEEDDGENKAIDGAIQETNSQEISRFNNYIDAIYRRMNAALRAKLMDPMVLNLEQKGKKEVSEKKAKVANKRVERDAQDLDDEELVETVDDDESQLDMGHRVGEPKTKSGGNKNKNKKGKKEKNKDKSNASVKNKNKKKDKKNKEGKEAKKAAAKQKRKEEKEKAKELKEKSKKEKEDAKAAKKAAKIAKAERKEAKAARKNNEDKQTRESRSRDHSKKHGQHHNKKKAGKSIKKGSNGNKKDKKDKKEKKNNKDKKDNKKSKGKGSKGKARTDTVKESKVMGSLAGIATLRRSGDVTVQDDENHKVVTSSFTVGPLQLEVSKTLGQGKSRTVKTAKATTDVMSGTMVLKVKPDGSAHVKKVVFSKPEKVDVKGSLSDNKPRSISYLKNSVNRMRPIAAQKILKTARYVLKAPATVKQ